MADDGQTQPAKTGGFRGEERLDGALKGVARHSDAIVDDS